MCENFLSGNSGHKQPTLPSPSHCLSGMNNQCSSSAIPCPPTASKASMFDNTTGVDINESKFISSGHDTKYTIQNVQNNYNIGVIRIPDIIGYIAAAAEPFVALIRTNQSTDAADCSGPLPKATTTDTPPSPIAEGYLVDAEISNISSLDPSSLPVASIADRYARSMLQCLHGYALYDPQPFSEFSKEYLHNGVNVGDVGFVRGDGTFDFLFNIGLPQDSSISSPNLPDGFCLTPGHSGTRPMRPHPHQTYIFHGSVTRTNSGEYRCEGSEGAILELPEGAIEHEAINVRAFKNLAACRGVEWYKYAMTRGREIPNGSLYLITSFTKCTQWGIAVFDRPCAPGQGLRFDSKLYLPFFKSNPKYHWKGSGASSTRVATSNQQDTPNQCVFLRGYKITIRQDIYDNLCKDELHRFNVTQQKATRIRGGGGTDPIFRRLTKGSLLTKAMNSAAEQSSEVVLHANFNSSPIHPSDFINAALLSQNSAAKVALTHDDVWCDLLRDNFPELNHATLMNIARSYTSTVDEYGCVSLEKTRISDSSNDETSLGSPALQGPIQSTCPTAHNEENTPVPIENPMPSVQEKNDNVGRSILYEVYGDTVIFQLGDGHYTEQERGMIRHYLSNVTTFTLRDIDNIMNNMKSHPLTPSILSLPNPQAAYGDYQIKNKHVSCIKGTRLPLLQEIADWISGTDETRMYVLSGPAEIGKSTIAYTIAAQADALGLLGASFFFSRDNADRDNGKMFFTAIAYQLCLYNDLFAKAIDAALLTKPLSDATMKDPQEQLEALILEPLRNIVRSRIRPILIVVDALNECEKEEGLSVLTGLSQLVRDLPSFKVILTTRPQSHFDHFFHSQDNHKIFHVQNVEEDDTWLYPRLSQELVEEQPQERMEGVHASAAREGSLVRAIEKHIIRTDAPFIPFSENFNTGNTDEAGASQEVAREQLQDRAEGGHVGDIENKVINDDARPYLQPRPSLKGLRKKVRFATINDGIISHSSSTSSSIGPFEPPMYVAGAHASGRPQPVIPSHVPPPIPTFIPVPVSTGMTIHPVLALLPSSNSPVLQYDLIDPPSRSALYLRSKDVIRSLARVLDEPATSPPVSHLTVYCPHLPWTIRVLASSISKGYITVNDVLFAIYNNLRGKISRSEYELLQNKRDRDRAAQAYRDRCKRLRDSRQYEAEKSGGMRRIDFLMDETRFGGLSRGVDGWMLSVMR